MLLLQLQFYYFSFLFRTQEIKPSGPNISKRIKNIIKNPKREIETSQPKPSPSLSAINLNKPKTSVVSPLSVPRHPPSTNHVTSTTTLHRNNAVTSSVAMTATLNRNNAVTSSKPTSTKPASTVNAAVMQKPFR